MADESSGSNLIWGLAAIVGATALLVLALSVLSIAVAIAWPVILHGTLAGIALAPGIAAVAAGGVGVAGAATGVAVVGVLIVRAVEFADKKPFQLTVASLAIANGVFMAVAYELIPEAPGGVMARILVSGLSPAGLVIGAVIFDKPGVWSKIAGAVLHILLQGAAIAAIVAMALRDPSVREETLAKFGLTSLPIGLGALAAITIVPAFIFLIWNARPKGPAGRRAARA